MKDGQDYGCFKIKHADSSFSKVSNILKELLK